MIVKVVLDSMQDARKLVSIVERIPYEAELCSGRYVVNAKSMLGVLGMPVLETCELHVHTDNEDECEAILRKLLEQDLLADTNDSVRRSITDITGKAGKDMHGEFLRAVLEKENVNVSGFVMDEKYFTTLAFVDVNEDGERTFSFARKPGADTQIRKEEVDVDILDRTHIFHVGSLSLTDQPARDTTFYAVKRAKSKGSIISYDPNYRASLWKDEETAKQHMRSLIPYADMVKISDEETELLTGYGRPEDAAEYLLGQGVKVAAVTLGSEGAYVCSRFGGCRVPGYPSRVADTNGAGDSFWGGFLYRVNASGRKPEDLTLEELESYARFGNAVASLCVEKRGAIPAMPDLRRAEERMEEIR